MNLINFVGELLFYEDLSNELIEVSRKKEMWGWSVDGVKNDGLAHLKTSFQTLMRALECLYEIKVKATQISNQSYREKFFRRVKAVKIDIMTREVRLFFAATLYEGEDCDKIRDFVSTHHRLFLETQHACKLLAAQSCQSIVPSKPSPTLSCDQDLDAISEAFEKGILKFNFEWLNLVQIALCDLHLLKLNVKSINQSDSEELLMKIDGLESRIKDFGDKNIEQCFCLPRLKQNLSYWGISW